MSADERLLEVAEDLATRHREDPTTRDRLCRENGISETQLEAAVRQDVMDTINDVLPHVIEGHKLNAVEFGAVLATQSHIWFQLGLEWARLNNQNRSIV